MSEPYKDPDVEVERLQSENERLRARVAELEELFPFAAEPAKLEARPQFPEGKLSDDDEGEIDVLVGSDVAKALVVISFPSPVAWAAMSPAQAREVASSLERHAVRAEKKPEETP